MKRVGHIAYRLLTALSLLLLLTTAGVWARSYWVSDTVNWFEWPPDSSYLDMKVVSCSRGGLQLSAYRYFKRGFRKSDGARVGYSRQPATRYPILGDEWDSSFLPPLRRFTALGFEWIPRAVTRVDSTPPWDVVLKSLTLPLYFPCLLFALLPAHYFFRLRRRRRIAKRLAQGCCIHCGYDLRASTGRCPECGREGPPVGAPAPCLPLPAASRSSS